LSELDKGLRSNGLTKSEREELNRFRWENRLVREDREILSNGSCCVVKTTGAMPSQCSHSWG
jgi:transposase